MACAKTLIMNDFAVMDTTASAVVSKRAFHSSLQKKSASASLLPSSGSTAGGGGDEHKNSVDADKSAVFATAAAASSMRKEDAATGGVGTGGAGEAIKRFASSSSSSLSTNSSKSRYLKYVEVMVYTDLPEICLLSETVQCDDVMTRAFHAVTLWIAMLLKRYYESDDDLPSPPVERNTIKKIICNSVLLGIYMWDVVCMRLQCRKFRAELCRHSTVVASNDASRFRNFAQRMRSECNNMASRMYVESWPEISIRNVVHEFDMEGVVRSEHTIPVRTDPQRANLDKRYSIVQMLEPLRNNRDPRTNYEIEVMIHRGAVNQLYKNMCEWRCTKKFAWFVFYALPLRFTLYMLKWFARIDGTDPHSDFVRAEPLFAFYYYKLSGRVFSDQDASTIATDEHSTTTRKTIGVHTFAPQLKNVRLALGGDSGDDAVAAQAKTPNLRECKDDAMVSDDSDSAADQSSPPPPPSHGQEELIGFLHVMLRSIRCTVAERRCRVCSTKLISVLSGSTSTTESENAILRQCPVAMCALSIKRRVQNMTKAVGKRHSEFVLERSASPVLKQMLSLVSTIAKMRDDCNRRCSRGNRRNSFAMRTTKTSSESNSFGGAAAAAAVSTTLTARPTIAYKYSASCDKVDERLDAVRCVDDMREFTVYPFTIEELLCIKDVRTFVVNVNMASGTLAHLSIHVLDPLSAREHSRFLVYTPFFYDTRRDGRLARGSRRTVTSYIISGIDNVAAFWRASPFDDAERIVNVRTFRLCDKHVNRFCERFPRVVADFVDSCKLDDGKSVGW